MTDVLLSADEHFAQLRDGVWRRLCAREGFCSRERFDEAYAEWWAREVERAAQGRPSRVSAPVAFIAESVHRVLVDEARARGRGLARAEKASLEIVDLESQAGTAAARTTADDASYEALVHRILALVQGELSARELRVFVYVFLYMASTARTAAALGLTEPRVKKDRDKIARTVGERVWEVLNGELELCADYDRKQLGAVFELLSVHVEDCPTCRTTLRGVRKGALAVVPPVEVLALAGASEGVGDALSSLVDALTLRFSGAAHRVSEALAAVPPGGRTAAAVAVAATAMAGGAVSVTKAPERHAKRQHVEARRTPEPRRTPTPAPARAARTPAAAPARTAHRRPVPTAAPVRAKAASRPPARKAVVVPTPAPTREPATSFEQQDVAQAPPPPVSVPAAAPAAPAPPPPPKGEFGFESG